MFSVKASFKQALVLAALVASAGAMQAAVKLPAVISDRMVLQKADSVPIWGWANPGEAVSVSLDGVSANTKANADGKWQVKLDLSKSGQGPFKMQIKGDNAIEINDVVIGQVWLASGQSNMEWRLRNTIDADKEVAAGAGNFVREFSVAKATSTSISEDVKGEWVIAEPGKTGNFSAVAYFFAKKLNQELKQPVGIIHTSWGGTPSEAWTSEAALATDKDLDAARKNRNALTESFPKRKAEFDSKLSQWLKQHNIADGGSPAVAEFAGSSVDTSKWPTVNFGTDPIKHKELPERGVIWLRRDINVSKGAAGKDLRYQVQEGRGFFTIYWNGERVGGPQAWTEAELKKSKGQGNTLRFTIPGKLVKEGKNEMAIRIYSPIEVPARVGWRNTLDGSAGFSMNLNGGWKAKAEKAFDIDAKVVATGPKAVAAAPDNHHQPARLYNAMLAPLAPYRLAGVIWYQGESNAGRAWQYRTAFPMMIQDWRKLWNEPNLPFYFCQLANYQKKNDAPGESGWAELREAQTYALKLPNTGQAVLIDLGEAEDIHPRNKKDVGDRLALLALANDYGRDVVSVGPTYEDKAVVGNKMYIKFKDEGKGSELAAHKLPDTYPLKTLNNTNSKLVLPSPESELQGFMICGPDKKWVWAEAKIEGKHSVAVWSPQVQEPVAVRYAWANNPTCNLYNEAGLPAVPFRTDDFQATTINGRY